MGFLNNILDRFKNAEVEIAPNKKLKTLSAGFKEVFDLTLVFYKGRKIAEGDLTLAKLDQKTSKTVLRKSDEAMKIKASMTVGDVEKMFEDTFGTVVQIKDKEGKKMVPNEITLGQAARGEY